MFNALCQHLFYLLTFRHNGKGLKTDKIFTFVLLFICLFMSMPSYEQFTIAAVVTNFLALLFLYAITNKDVVNGMLLGMFFFLLMTYFLPAISLLVLLWVLLAITKMQKNYSKS